MKRLLLFVWLLCFSGVISAQTPVRTAVQATDSIWVQPTTTYYLELSCRVDPASGATVVNLNPGRQLPRLLGMSSTKLNEVFSAQRYASPIDALNALSPYGWKIADSYTLTVRNVATVYWILGKDTTHPSQIMEGFSLNKATTR